MSDVQPIEELGQLNAQDAFAAFLALAERWELSTDQQVVLLGSPARSTYFKWKKDGGQLSLDTFERISHLLSIFKALEILFTISERSDQWLRKQNRYFGGFTALDVMLRGKIIDIIDVRNYLDAQRGG
jgi:hypothetical protein